jgi:hypothetical protein
MTINKLHKLLGGLITEGQGRRKVMIDKSTFRHALEADGCSILPIEQAEVICYGISDDDGGTKVTARGVECQETSLVLFGNNRNDNW